ncbi:hypothetical protein [Pseudomonas sp. HTZ2]|jgi:hypothetical protein|uniref:hypothetical protein n=1 Tax=Pseudomonas sp. HTZ2 TaxID=3075220 RepID=UPI0029587A4F|nr:hypothetical protein [Pseudomonas sp. HTZ2]
MKVLVVMLLVLIVLILAPGLAWVFAAGAVAYSAIIAVGGIFTFIFILSYTLWPSFKKWQAQRSTDAKIREANRIFREREGARTNSQDALNAPLNDGFETDTDRKSCSRCQVEMLSSSIRCPSCGHAVTLSKS